MVLSFQSSIGYKHFQNKKLGEKKQEGGLTELV